MEGEEDEEEPWREIGFFEGIDFLGAIDRKLDRERIEKNTTEDKAQERRKERNTMHDNAWACYVQK